VDFVLDIIFKVLTNSNWQFLTPLKKGFYWVLFLHKNVRIQVPILF